jgi:hypothetical protein
LQILGFGRWPAIITAYGASGRKALAESTYRRCCTALQEVGLNGSHILDEAYEEVTRRRPLEMCET